MAIDTAAEPDLYDLYLRTALVADRLEGELAGQATITVPNPADLLIDAPAQHVYLAATPADWSTIWSADPAAGTWHAIATGLAPHADNPTDIASAITAAFHRAARLPARLSD